MVSFEFRMNRHLMLQAEHNTELIQFLTKIAVEHKITFASFTAIGALKRAKIAFYNQIKHEYQSIIIDTPQEIASCIGNISIKDKKHFIHVHVVLADEKGNVKAGHLIEGIIFASEIHLSEFNGLKLERRFDERTGLSLWEKESIK